MINRLLLKQHRAPSPTSVNHRVPERSLRLETLIIPDVPEALTLCDVRETISASLEVHAETSFSRIAQGLVSYPGNQSRKQSHQNLITFCPEKLTFYMTCCYIVNVRFTAIHSSESRVECSQVKSHQTLHLITHLLSSFSILLSNKR